jgi:hypothetical protein
MSRRILNLLFISFISCCLVIGLFGRIARAADDDEPKRSAKAYEEEYTCIGGMCYYTGRQYTSQYDLMRGEIYPEINVQYAMPNFGAMFNPFAPVAESSSRGSAIGGLFSGPMMRFPTSPLSYMMGTLGAPQYETSQSYSPWTGSMNYMSMYPGLGFQGAGFMLGPFSGYGSAAGYGGYGGWGGGYGGYGGYGGFPTMIW